MFAMVARSGTVRFDTPGPKNSTNRSTTPTLSKLFGDVKHEVSCGRALGEFSSKADADDFGKLHRDGLAEHRGFGLNTPRPPADDADAADHRRVAVRPHEGVGEEPLFAVTLAGVDDLSEVFEIHLVNDTPVPGGTTRKSSNAC